MLVVLALRNSHSIRKKGSSGTLIPDLRGESKVEFGLRLIASTVKSDSSITEMMGPIVFEIRSPILLQFAKF